MPSKIEHIGIAVSNIDQVVKIYTGALGMELEGIESLPEHGVRVAILRNGSQKVELMEPLYPQSTLAKFIEKRGEGLHHLGLEVEDIASTIADLHSKGLTLIDMVARPGAGKHMVAFVHPREAKVLLELVEKPATKKNDH